MIYDTWHSEQCKLFIIVFKIVTSITSLFKFYRSGVRFLGLRAPSAPGTVAVRSDLTFTGQTMKTKSRWLEQYEYRSWPQNNIQPSDWGDLQKVDRAGRRDVHRCRQLRCQLPQRSWYQGATRLPQKKLFLKKCCLKSLVAATSFCWKSFSRWSCPCWPPPSSSTSCTSRSPRRASIDWLNLV